MQRAGNFKVRVTRTVDVRQGRGIIAFNEGWVGRVVPEVYEKLMEKGAAENLNDETDEAEHSADASPEENASG